MKLFRKIKGVFILKRWYVSSPTIQTNAMQKDGLVTVQTDSGPVLGRSVVSPETDGTYLSFQGIPYAQPPVGPLRFKPPAPVVPWTQERDCRQESACCVQYHMLFRDLRGSEDCLYLNVYTPQLSLFSATPLPVMVNIHGGGFATGSGGSELSGPDFIVSENIVLVTLNYRLNLFGFLSVDEPGDAQGNMGLKDQVAALKWVSRNISAFGGDPHRVTIVGESAGAASVHFHLMSPMSQGLFSRAISQSGSALNPWATTKDSRQRAFRVGESLGCKTSDSKTLLEFLRSVPAEKLFKHSAAAFSKEDREYNYILRPFSFVPTIERTDGSVEPFLAEEPMALLNEGRFFKGPFLAGVNSCEGLVIMSAFLGKDENDLFKSINSRTSKLLPDGVRRGSPEEERVSKLLRSYYLKNSMVTKENIPDFINMVSDLMFVHRFYVAMKLHSKFTSPYVYVFSYEGGANMFKNALGLGSDCPGACHADELAYIFQTDLSPSWKELPSDSPDVLTRRRMVRLWTNFAKTGNPTPIDDELFGVRWLPATEGRMNYLDINTSLVNHSGFVNEERMKFCDGLLERNSSKL